MSINKRFINILNSMYTLHKHIDKLHIAARNALKINSVTNINTLADYNKWKQLLIKTYNED